MATYTVRGTYEVRFEMHVIAESPEAAEELVLDCSDSDILENQTGSVIYLHGAA